MATKLITWDNEKTSKEIRKRFSNSQDARKNLENRWIANETTLYAVRGNMGPAASSATSLQNVFQYGMPGIDGSNADMNIAYTFKNLRLIHAQMSANPPSVAMRPATSDQEDHRRADAADKIVRWAIRKYLMQEKIDQLSLNALVYGTGFIKTVWDSTRGEIIKFDEETDEIELEGDIAVTNPHTWNIFLDPDAKSWDECKWVIERIYMDYDEACARWPERAEALKEARVERSVAPTQAGRTSYTEEPRYNSVELLEYWETGLPTNGFLGRYCITTVNGDVVEPVRPSPHRFKKPGASTKINAADLPDEVKEARIDKLPEVACLPYAILTDIDIPNYVWGRSFVEYASLIQENLNRLDSAVLDNIQAHGVARLVVPEGAEIADDSLSNSPWDVTRIANMGQNPYYVSPPQLMPDMTTARQHYVEGIDTVSGVNESMFGQQSREQSGASMQYATNQGNMVRRRLFNKYTIAVEAVYKNMLSLFCKHWTIPRTIAVLGKEKALESVDFKGADIDGGYDVVGEYGTTLSLDPVTRREEILTMQPLFEKAGVPARTSMKMLKLNEIEGMFDRLDLAGNRQKEIFDQMIATGRYLQPEDLMDHENMIAWALDYFMTQEFTVLPDEIKQLLKQHIRDRGKVAAQEQAGGAGAAGAAPGAVAAPANAAPGPVPGQPAGPVPEAGGPAALPAPAAQG